MERQIKREFFSKEKSSSFCPHCSAKLLVLKHRALHHFMQQRSQAVILVSHAGHDGFDLRDAGCLIARLDVISQVVAQVKQTMLAGDRNVF